MGRTTSRVSLRHLGHYLTGSIVHPQCCFGTSRSLDDNARSRSFQLEALLVSFGSTLAEPNIFILCPFKLGLSRSIHFLWITDGRMPTVTLCCSLIGIAEHSLLVPYRPTTELLAKPSLSLRRSFVFLASFSYCPVHFFSVVRLPTSPKRPLSVLLSLDFHKRPWEFLAASQQWGPNIWTLQSRRRIYFSQTTGSGVSTATVLRMPGSAELS